MWGCLDPLDLDSLGPRWKKPEEHWSDDASAAADVPAAEELREDAGRRVETENMMKDENQRHETLLHQDARTLRSSIVSSSNDEDEEEDDDGNDDPNT
ncbi:uncharacterized protein V6R79_010448 [Siganus canaliculatus]